MCKKERKRNMGGLTRRMCLLQITLVMPYGRKEMCQQSCVCPTTYWQARALEEPCWHHDGAGLAAESKQLPRFSFGGSFFLSLQFFGPFSPSSLHLPVPLVLSQSLPSSKGLADVHTHLLSFRCHFLCLGPCQCWFKGIIQILSCSFPFPHESLGKVVLGIYRGAILYIYEFVEINRLSYFATVLSI